MYWMKLFSTLCVFRSGLLRLRNRNLCGKHSLLRSREKSMDQKRPERRSSTPMGSCPSRAIIIYTVLVYIYICVCVCVSVYIYIYMLVYIYVLVHMFVYVSICISLMSEFWVDGGESKSFTVDEPWKMWKPRRLDTQIITKLDYNRPWPWRTTMTLPLCGFKLRTHYWLFFCMGSRVQLTIFSGG